MDGFSVIFLLLTAAYGILLGSAAVGLRKVLRRSSAPSGEWPHVSVIIPARNEEGSIGTCLDAVLANDYPAERLEVIVVDDGSTDRTGAVVRQYMKSQAVAASPLSFAGDPDDVDAHVRPSGMLGDADESPSVRLIRMPDDPSREAAHKKYALARGVAESNGEIILTTDADCRVPASWIRTMSARFGPDTGMVTGPVLYRDDGAAFGRIQALEFLGLVALGAGFVGIGRPHLCNSANLAYRRAAYEDVGGYRGIEGVSTGDDEMLLHKMAYESRWTIDSCMEQDAAVVTDPSETIDEFLAQRTRWASAHARYPHRRLTAISVACYLFFAGLLVSVVLGRWELFAAALVVKIAAEAAVLMPATRRFERLDQLPLLLPAQLVHIPYILYIGLAGTFGGYEWKGRRLTR